MIVSNRNCHASTLCFCHRSMLLAGIHASYLPCDLNSMGEVGHGCQLKACCDDRNKACDDDKNKACGDDKVYVREINVHKAKNQWGFTLIELLVVIVIISIVASFAALSINLGQKKHVKTVTTQITNLLHLAQEEALLQSTTFGFLLTPTTYQFYEYFPQQNSNKNPWVKTKSPPLSLHSIPDDIKITIKTQASPASNTTPQLVLPASGDTPSFTIYIGKKGEKPLYKIVGNINGVIKSEEADAEK